MPKSGAALLFSLLVLVVAAPVAQGPVPGFADAILGRWDLTVHGADGPYPSWLEVMLRKETELMGRFVGRSGSNRHVSEITYGGGERPIDLFDGKTLAGWRLRDDTRGRCWSVVDAALTNAPPCIDIITDRTFADFKLHVEFSIVPKSNSGVYLRGRYEVQIQDDVGKATDSLRMGGVYGFLNPAVNAAGRPGEWQTFDITLVGRRVTVVLNGRTIVDDAEIPGITGGALDSDEAAPGPLMLQGDHGKVAYRKVVITPAE